MDFLGNQIGIGTEAFALMEGDLAAGDAEQAPESEAEVKVSVRSNEDEADATTSNESTAEAEDVADKGAELFTDILALSSIKQTMDKEGMTPALYSFINADNNLGRLLGLQLPASESFVGGEENCNRLKASIESRLNAYFETNVARDSQNFFAVLLQKIKKMDTDTVKLVAARKQRVAELLARLEGDTTDKEETTPTPAPEEVTVTNETDGEGGETTTTTEETPDGEKEEVSTTVNDAEECMDLMKAINLSGGANTPIMQIDAILSGDKNASEKAVNFVRTSIQKLAAFRANGVHRTITFKKEDLKQSLEQYKAMLDSWDNFHRLQYACTRMIESAKATPLKNHDALMKVYPTFQVCNLVQNYLRTVKKSMDSVYTNLNLATRCLLKKGVA